MAQQLLRIDQLQVGFPIEGNINSAIHNLSLELYPGETLGIVGESGSGKSITALSVMQLLPTTARITGGSIWFAPRNATQPLDLTRLKPAEMRKLRGAEMGMIFQEPMSALNPVMRCGVQITEVLQLHENLDYKTAFSRTLQLFDQVKLPDPERIFRAYPHQISGGQKQRVLIAMAMACNPALLIADEPTTALDVTVQKSILDLLLQIKLDRGLSMLFISHDLGVIADICDRVAVMYQGQLVETGPVAQILSQPVHAYTKGLLASRPSLTHKYKRLPVLSDFLGSTVFIQPEHITKKETEQRHTELYAQKPLLRVENLGVQYPIRKNWLGQTIMTKYAVQQVGFQLFQGETLGLAGESGCGKTSVGRALVRLTPAFTGQIWYGNVDLRQLKPHEFRTVRKEIQMVFQDPYAALNPRMRVGEAILEPMEVYKIGKNKKERKEKVVDLLETVGLEADHYKRYPHAFSGGQRQRICLARALALEPKILICDEIVSALDVSVQATVLNLLQELQAKFGLTYLFISHDLSVLHQMCDRLLVMNQGKIIAEGYPEALFSHSNEPLVRQLVEATPGRKLLPH